jgi:hypothetical protein
MTAFACFEHPFAYLQEALHNTVVIWLLIRNELKTKEHRVGYTVLARKLDKMNHNFSYFSMQMRMLRR